MPLPAPSPTTICRQALALIRATLIVDIDEQSNEAEKCRIFYYPIVAAHLEGPHDWSFANQRVQLAQASNNARPFEWLYAYNMPANCAAPIQVLPDFTTLGIAIPLPLPGVPYQETWAVLNNYSLPYIIESGILYCNAQNAWLDYTINDITGIPETNKFADAVATELAAKLAVPLKGDSNRERELLPLSELAWERAIADDRNRQPETYGNYESEAMAARHRDCGGYPSDF